MNAKLLAIAAAILSLTLPAHAVPAAENVREQADEAVKRAKTVYAKIQESEPSSTRKIPFKLENDPMEGTIVKREYAGGLKAITLDYVAGDHGGSTEHYYYENDELVFAFVKDSHWTFAPGGTPEKPKTEDTLVERRFYFRDGTCVRALERSATSGEPGKLAQLISGKENKEVAPDPQRVGLLLKTARGLLIVNRGAMAQDFFESLHADAP